MTPVALQKKHRRIIAPTTRGNNGAIVRSRLCGLPSHKDSAPSQENLPPNSFHVIAAAEQTTVRGRQGSRRRFARSHPCCDTDHGQQSRETLAMGSGGIKTEYLPNWARPRQVRAFASLSRRSAAKGPGFYFLSKCPRIMVFGEYAPLFADHNRLSTIQPAIKRMAHKSLRAF